MLRTCAECDGVIQPNQLYCRRCGALPEENEEATLSALFDDITTPIAIPVGTDDTSLDPTAATVATASVTLCNMCTDGDYYTDIEKRLALKSVEELDEGNTPEGEEPGCIKRFFCCFSSAKNKDGEESMENDDASKRKGCLARLFGWCACSKNRTDEEPDEMPAFHFGKINQDSYCAKMEFGSCCAGARWDLFFPILFCMVFFGGVVGLIAWLATLGDGSDGTRSGSSYVGIGGRGGGGRGGGSSSSCFPGDSLVEIKRPSDGTKKSRFVYIKDVQLNDEVRSGLGFSTVYAFGTKIPGDGAPPVQMLQLRTETGCFLETTKNHLVYAGKGPSQNKAILAQDVMIGDLVKTFEGPLCDNNTSPILRASRVVAISNISKEEGTYHPLTNDGNIVVNGVLASAHAVDGVVPKVQLWGFELVGIQAFQQLLYSPLRVLCYLSSEDFCSEIHHDLEDGSHLYLNVMEPLLRFMFPKTSWVDQVYDRQEEVNFLERAPYFTLRILLLGSLFFCAAVESLLSHLALTVSILIFVPLTIAAMSHKKAVRIYNKNVKTD